MKLEKNENVGKILQRHESEISLIIKLMAVPAILRTISYVKRFAEKHKVVIKRDGDKEVDHELHLGELAEKLASVVERITFEDKNETNE